MDRSALPPAEILLARDGTPLSLRRYPARAEVVVVALHGSSAEGTYFQPLAASLSRAGQASVVVPDLRGHGASGGRRGDVDYIGQLEDDLSDLLAHERRRQPGVRVVLLGHSSGGGLVVRFAGGRRPERPDGYVLLAPFLGAVAPTTRPGSGGWALPDLPVITDLATRAARSDTSGQEQVALRFNKPPEQRTGREVLEYSFRMMVSYHPRHDLASELAALRQPLLVLCGAQDQSFVAEAYEPTIAPHAPGTFRVLPGVNHLGLAVSPLTAAAVGAWLAELAPGTGCGR